MKILVIAPHPDDEVLGCGGTIAKHVNNDDSVYVAIVTKGCEPLFPPEQVDQVREECKKADAYLGVKATIFMDFPASMLETVSRYEFNGAFMKLIQSIKPDIVYLPHRGDMQLDHKMVVDAAMVALRPKYSYSVKKIYAYETLSETGWDLPNTTNEFIPTSYNDISCYLDKKIEALRMFKSQVDNFPNARSIEAVKALAIYRGSSMNLKAAESFYCIREVLR
ncbi:PIG-L deacetylase family protein [[Clostridium] aminophilum]|uniref:N-acetylglucosaminyl deacetylase, LmbE family n=1 Tax=[Clostridium] aminophilum TaxID=1526 RepID=A0A1I6K5X1_9FIRM|nr:PIG-L deacetylase family protein [[Clostridium] aminophilum]SFR86596.1 N-acetylglucosaminyl deacetylase, LmbE family [[Clostridium] aminophilum]